MASTGYQVSGGSGIHDVRTRWSCNLVFFWQCCIIETHTSTHPHTHQLRYILEECALGMHLLNISYVGSRRIWQLYNLFVLCGRRLLFGHSTRMTILYMKMWNLVVERVFSARVVAAYIHSFHIWLGLITMYITIQFYLVSKYSMFIKQAWSKFYETANACNFDSYLSARTICRQF